MRKFALILALLFALSTFVSAQDKSKEKDAILGNWITGNKLAKVQIYKTGEKYYGKIIWLKEPNDKEGKPKTDKENTDEKLRSRPIMGLIMLKNFSYDEDYVWKGGEIYDPKNGKTYSCKMTMENHGRTLKVRGYIGISLIGRTDEWTKAD
jgi:uncharacterized protein (DUF2147 family)